MFKKMKRRLVFWNMLLLVIVFAVILLAIAVITTVNSYRDTREMLKITLAASQFPAGGFHEPPKEGMSGGIPMSAITVRCDGSGTVLGIKAPPQADENLIREAVSLALGKGKDTGYLALNHEIFAFARGYFGGQQTVVLLDQQAQMSSIRSTLLTLLAISGVSLLLLFRSRKILWRTLPTS